MDLKEAATRALLETIIFLEFSGEEIINPDISIGLMEQIASNLQVMSDEGIQDFIKICITVKSEYQDESDKTEFLTHLGENFGLIDE